MGQKVKLSSKQAKIGYLICIAISSLTIAFSLYRTYIELNI